MFQFKNYEDPCLGTMSLHCGDTMKQWIFDSTGIICDCGHDLWHELIVNLV